jgi:hypothetical protein
LIARVLHGPSDNATAIPITNNVKAMTLLRILRLLFKARELTRQG